MLKEHVIAPALKSLITGLFVGLAALGIAYYKGVGSLWAVFLVIMTVAMALSWLLLVGRSGGESVDNTTFKATGRYRQVDTIRVEVAQLDGNAGEWIDLPAREGQLILLGKGLTNGLTFSEGSWTGKGAIFLRSQFRTLRDAMITSGLAEWVDPRYRAQGVKLTGSGRAVMRRFAAMNTSSPEEEHR